MANKKFSQFTVATTATDASLAGLQDGENVLVPVELIERPYKVYTALLTQNGGDDPLELSSGAVTKGVTYQIAAASDGDFTNVGAPNNNENTFFVAINNDVPTSYGSCTLIYDNGAPTVTVLENTIGNIWFTYSTPGIYNIYSDALFNINKTAVLFGSCHYSNFLDTTIGFGVNNYNSNYPNQINIETIQIVGEIRVDDVLINDTIEIRVYN